MLIYLKLSIPVPMNCLRLRVKEDKMADVKEIMIQSQILRINPSKSIAPSKAPSQAESEKFASALESADIKLSKHASRRIDSRKIELSEMDYAKLSDAMNSLEKKGARDSLVLMGEKAFIVNVPSKTVVTALSKEQMQEQVFTNIDSTILLNQ